MSNEEGFRLCLEGRKSLPTLNCWSLDQDKKHFMSMWEILKHSEPGFAIELEAYKTWLQMSIHRTNYQDWLAPNHIPSGLFSSPEGPYTQGTGRVHHRLLEPVSWNHSPGFNQLSLRIKTAEPFALELF